MNGINISIRTRSLPWRARTCELRLCGQPWNLNNRDLRRVGSRRCRSTSRDQSEFETIDVRCGSSGTITVDIYNSQELANPLTPLIIYLPPTGSHLQHTHPPLPNFLSNLPFPSAIAQINYRWNINSSTSSSPETRRQSSFSSPLSISPGYNDHPFPIPIHDTVFAFDFLTTNYVPSIIPSFSTTARKGTNQRPLIIAGSFLGGTIATSLALTTTYASATKSFQIVGLVAQNAVLDWTGVTVSKNSEERYSGVEIDTPKAWDTQTLHFLKKALFSSPQNAFDHFASPILFFRTSGLVVPPRWAAESNASEEMNRYSTSVEDIPAELSIGDLETEAAASTQQTEKVEVGTETMRISYLKFPPNVTQTSSSSFSRYADSSARSSQTQLKIPHSLFLYSSHTSPNSDLHTTPKEKLQSSTKSTKRTAKAKTKKKTTKEEEIATPESQAKEMAKVMRRSVLLYECKDRTMWDEGFDAHGFAGERVSVLNLDCDGVEEDLAEGSEGRDIDERIREWMEDSLG